MGLGGVISNLLSLGTKLITAVSAPAHPPSSSSPPEESHEIEVELEQLMRLLKRIKATLYDAEGREIMDESVKLWLKELKGVAYDAEDVLNLYHYQVLQAQVEARCASAPNSLKRKLAQVPDDMLNQIRQIRTRFTEIEKDRLALRLSEEDGPKHYNSDLRIAPTSHFVVESNIIGREWEKEHLISILCAERHDDDEIISVVTIVGTGGIGKTTLAKLVYDDQRIQQNFDKFAWLCVSDDFNAQRLTTELFESIAKKSCSLTNLSVLQEVISAEIRGERVFLVMDDVWNENRTHWESFRFPLLSALSVKILVTTRNEPVSQVMQTMTTYNLGYMPEEQSWQMFQHYAFGEVVKTTDSYLLEIGKQIMKKCGMLPLAVKSIASLLRHEPNEKSWREILESNLWESNVGNEIFQPLQISYARLPTYLKPCFLYCSMFPRDYCFYADELVKLWISQGYVLTNGLKNVEKIGREYVEQLCQRSFFEVNFASFTVHDVMHDLARFNSGHVCYSVEGDMVPNFPKELYHLYIRNWEPNVFEPPPLQKFTTLRSFIMEDNQVKSFVGAFDFSELKKLRVLKLETVYADSHFSFGQLKHLRYLCLRGIDSERLPECSCSLYNLQTLILLLCSHLRELPENIGNLVSLEELTIELCYSLRVLPTSLCQLKTLPKLCLWQCNKLEKLPPNMENLASLEEVTFSNCLNLRVLPVSLSELRASRKIHSLCCELKELASDMRDAMNLELKRMLSLEIKLTCKTIGWLRDFDLEGTLTLVGLRFVHSLEDVHGVTASMHYLQGLKLSWASHARCSKIDHFALLGGLQPHPNLRELEVECYRARMFPDWIGIPSYVHHSKKFNYYSVILRPFRLVASTN